MSPPSNARSASVPRGDTERSGLDDLDLRAQEPAAQLAERRRVAGGDETMPGRRGVLGAQRAGPDQHPVRSEEHTSELQSWLHLVCRLLLEKKKKQNYPIFPDDKKQHTMTR